MRIKVQVQVQDYLQGYGAGCREVQAVGEFGKRVGRGARVGAGACRPRGWYGAQGGEGREELLSWMVVRVAAFMTCHMCQATNNSIPVQGCRTGARCHVFGVLSGICCLLLRARTCRSVCNGVALDRASKEHAGTSQALPIPYRVRPRGTTCPTPPRVASSRQPCPSDAHVCVGSARKVLIIIGNGRLPM